MSEKKLIANRIEKVTGELSILHSQITALNAELVELESAAAVIARLRGDGAASAVGVNVSDPTSKGQGKGQGKVVSKPHGLPTMPELIRMALKEVDRPLSPKEITDVIREMWWPDVEGQKIGSIVWRLNNRDDIEKVEGTSTYRLPQKREDTDDNPSRNTSMPSLFNTPAKDREAGSGGGP